MIPELLNQLKGLTSAIHKSEAINVNSKTIKEAAIATGSYYFKECRAEADRILANQNALVEMDEDWQQLIRLAHGNNAKKSYLLLLKRLIKKTTNLTVATHMLAPYAEGQGATTISYSEAENILISTLDQLIPSAAQSYRQGLEDLQSTNERLSYRGTACEFREAFREILDLLAPDGDVSKQSWFKQDPDCKGLTMKQKVRYVLTSRGKNKTERLVAERSVDLIEGLCGEVARAVYDRASLSTHVQTTKNEVGQMKRYLDAILFDILEIAQKK